MQNSILNVLDFGPDKPLIPELGMLLRLGESVYLVSPLSDIPIEKRDHVFLISKDADMFIAYYHENTGTYRDKYDHTEEFVPAFWLKAQNE